MVAQNSVYHYKRKIATKIFRLCFAAKEKFYWHFLATTFSHLATEKKGQSPAGACLKKLISDPGKRAISKHCQSTYHGTLI